MNDLIQTIEFFAVFSMAIEMGFATLFSLPPVYAFFKKNPDKKYLKRLLVLAFCLLLCAALYKAVSADKGALFLERIFGQKVPVVDVLLSALILAGGSRAIHDILKRLSGATAQKLLQQGKP
ncbi:MAG TPA: hypothetical protein P5079_04345 [Elusimicrobiota bacterium]|nr:hypothetical protein [Elusimicrobiota bacterium]